MKKYITTILLAVTLLAGGYAFAGSNFKIGVIDYSKLKTATKFRTYTDIAANNPQIKAMRDQMFNERAQMVKLQKQLDDQKGVLSAQDKTTLKEKITELRAKVASARYQLRTDTFKARKAAIANFKKEVDVSINKIAKSEKLRLVLNKQIIAYSSNTIDITNKVAAEIKAMYKKEKVDL